MRVVNLAVAKDALSNHVEYVRRGGRVRILVRGRAAADLVPVESLGGELTELEDAGVVQRATSKWTRELDRPGPKPRGRAASQTLVEERRSGR